MVSANHWPLKWIVGIIFCRRRVVGTRQRGDSSLVAGCGRASVGRCHQIGLFHLHKGFFPVCAATLSDASHKTNSRWHWDSWILFFASFIMPRSKQRCSCFPNERSCNEESSHLTIHPVEVCQAYIHCAWCVAYGTWGDGWMRRHEAGTRPLFGVGGVAGGKASVDARL